MGPAVQDSSSGNTQSITTYSGLNQAYGLRSRGELFDSTLSARFMSWQDKVLHRYHRGRTYGVMVDWEGNDPKTRGPSTDVRIGCP